MGFCTASIEHLQLCSLASGLNVVVTVIWRLGVGGVIWRLGVEGRETYYSVWRERSIRRVKTKMRKKKKEKRERRKKKKKKKGGGEDS